eukprot:m.149234 g.149234  ORF g.149234 m.149234 type:complete len:296 (-) comp30645_c1_seq2:69-956(-)
MAAIQRVSDRLDATRSDLLSEFVSTTQKHFVWISELNEALQSQNAKQESRSVMLPKTPSANKRRPKRKPLGVVNDGNTKAKRGGSASKQFAAPKMTVLADVEENKPAQPMTRQLRKRTVSILHKRPVTPDVPTEEPTSKKSKTIKRKGAPTSESTAFHFSGAATVCVRHVEEMLEIPGHALANVKCEHKGTVDHVFSHLRHTYHVHTMKLPKNIAAVALASTRGKWISIDEFAAAAVSTNMKKVLKQTQRIPTTTNTSTNTKRKQSTVSKVKEDTRQHKITKFTNNPVAVNVKEE